VPSPGIASHLFAPRIVLPATSTPNSSKKFIIYENGAINHNT